MFSIGGAASALPGPAGRWARPGAVVHVRAGSVLPCGVRLLFCRRGVLSRAGAVPGRSMPASPQPRCCCPSPGRVGPSGWSKSSQATLAPPVGGRLVGAPPSPLPATSRAFAGNCPGTGHAHTRSSAPLPLSTIPPCRQHTCKRPPRGATLRARGSGRPAPAFRVALTLGVPCRVRRRHKAGLRGAGAQGPWQQGGYAVKSLIFNCGSKKRERAIWRRPYQSDSNCGNRTLV